LMLTNVSLVRSTPSDSAQVIGLYSKYRETERSWLVLNQFVIHIKGDQPQQVRIPHELSEGNVGKAPAVFFTFSVRADAAPGGQISILNCMWEHAGFLMQLWGPNLPPEAMSKIGGSLS
jgi:hypothetical protein